MKGKPGKRVKDFSFFRFNNADMKGNIVKPGNDFIEFKKEDIYQFITQRFHQQVALYPRNLAIKTETQSLTYSELDKISRQIAQTLSGVSPNTQQGVALLFETGIDMVVGMLSTLKSGNFYIPLDPTYPNKRLTYMVKDSNAQFILTNNANYPLALQLTKDCPQNLELINIETLDKTFSLQRSSTAGEAGIHANPAYPAYILYTSGSTGVPKGVVQNHRNVLHFIRAYTNNLHICPQDRLTMLCSYSFDAAVMDIYGALLNGAALYPFDLKQEDALNRLIHWLREENLTIFHSIPTVYRYFTRLLTGEQGFPALRLLVMGGEALYKTDVENFKKYFPDRCIFINGLGPTESTVTLQYFMDKNSEINKEAVPVGFPVEETEVLLIDKNNREAFVYGTGEIIFKSDYLALGYLNHPEKTHQVFVKKTLTGKGRMFRSSDIGKRLPDGNIEYVGRKDQQVKIRGYRIEPAEIEKLLDKVEGIEKSVVICQRQPDDNSDNLLVAYYVNEKEKEIKKDHLIEILEDALPDYMLPSAFLSMDRLPLTPSGKIDRTALPGLALSHLTRENNVAPGSETELQLARIWSQVLGINKIGIHDNFFELGGHSLKAVTLIAKIHKEFNVKIPLALIFKSPTIKGLSRHLQETSRNVYESIEAVEKKEYYPMSSAQKRIYVLQRMELVQTSYNITVVVVLEGELRKEKLERGFNELIKRHESLRTSFEMIVDEPVQRIHQEVNFEIDNFDFKIDHVEVEVKIEEKGVPFGQKDTCGDQYTKSCIKNFIRPFDLSQAPLLRVGLINEVDHEHKHILMLDLHHIITDGTSMNLFFREFMALYNGNELFPLKFQYKDYAHWQSSEPQKKSMKSQEKYWVRQFSGEVPVLNLPLDYPRPVVQSFAGDRLYFELSAETTRRLNQLIQVRGTTLYILLLALYNILLSKLSGQEDIVVGTPTAGRRHADLDWIMGLFVNTLAPRNYPVGHKKFIDFLMEVKERTLQILENQNYPFEELVEKVSINRDTGRNPIFDTMFALQNIDTRASEIAIGDITGIRIRPYKGDDLPHTAKFDLSLTASEAENKLFFSFEYGIKLFKKETIQRFIIYFKQLVSAVLKNPTQKISGMEIITAEEKQQIVYDFNDTEAEYSMDKTIDQLFDYQAERIPDHTALIGKNPGTRIPNPKQEEPSRQKNTCSGNISITYLELNKRSRQSAYLLHRKGVDPDIIVAIMMERSIEMIIGILGILKAGGAYLPIAPEWPEQRKKYVLKDSGAKILLTSREIITLSSPQVYKTCPQDSSMFGIWDLGFGISPGSAYSHLHRQLAPATSLAYIIFTSGSTGSPKGVLIEHRSVVNVLQALQEKYPFSLTDTYLLKTSFLFDVSVTELFGWFIGGGCLAVLEKGGEKNPPAILDTIEKANVTHINFVPSMFRVLLETLDFSNVKKLSPLKYIFLAGEAFLPGLVKKFNQLNTGIILENIYGPTEATVYSSQYPLSEWTGGSIPIGKPLQNIRLYILDQYERIQPPGVPGELCIAGAGLARGYLNRPGLTANKFDHDLWDYKDYQDEKQLTIINSSFPFITPSPHRPIYRTGDLARWLPDGNIEFLGRRDHQVKIRGFRVELGEIETRLLKIQEIKETVVLSRKPADAHDNSLFAYFVSERELSLTQLREYLSQQLPDYMIPSNFVKIERIPLTPNGKIDRKALEVSGKCLTWDTVHVPPRNEAESKMVSIWKEVLQLDKIGIYDNYFDLGGTSFDIIRINTKLKEVFQVDIPLVTMFRYTTVDSLVNYLKGQKQEIDDRVEAVQRGKRDKIQRLRKRRGTQNE